jgi:hypothetical protein
MAEPRQGSLEADPSAWYPILVKAKRPYAQTPQA